MIRIQNEIAKTVPHFWDGIVFHPTDAIEDDWGQRILKQIAKDGAIRTVRLYTMFEDMVTLNETGGMEFDFDLNDQRIDFLLSLGFTPMVNYSFLPPWLCVHTEFTSSVAKNKLRYKGKMVTASYAKDPEIWGEICRVYTEHIAERYGKERVRGWYLQCYNEPDLSSFFMAEAGDSNDPEAIEKRLREYLKLYKAFAKAVKGVDPDFLIGNSIASRLPFMDGLLKDLAETGTPIDFMGIHTYGTGVNGLNSGEKPFDAMSCVQKERNFRALARKHFGRELPIVCDEWGAASSGFFNVEECPKMILREKSAFAAYFGKLITHYADEDVRPERLMICLSGQHEMTTDFSGFRNFFTLHFFKKPIYNAHLLANRLGERMLKRNADPENVTVYPTIDEKGKIAVLLAYASPHFDEALPEKTVEIALEGFAGEYDGTLFSIDADHTDPYALFLRLGLSDPLSDGEKEKLAAEGELKSEAFAASAAAPCSITLQNEGLYLIEFSPKKGEEK